MTMQRDADRPTADGGFTLIEVVVAIMIFAIIASGVVEGMLTISRMTADDRSRVVAANLAAEDIDLVRAVGDPFKIEPATITRSITGHTYTVTRTTSWVSSGGADVSCGSSTNIFYLRIDTKVSWTGQLPTTAPVQSDTLIAPAGRITDPTSGTVAVAVTGADGLPMPGIAVSIVPTSGGNNLASQPPATGADGCTYATKVAPGTYAVTISHSGFVDTAQQSVPVKSAQVVVGATAGVSFQYDAGTTFPVTYNDAYTKKTGVTPLLPLDLTTSFLNTTSGIYLRNTVSASVLLHPFPSGYQAVAGTLGASGGPTTCSSVDPAAWGAGKVGSLQLAAGLRSPAVAGPAGGTANGDLAVTMGVVTVKASGAGYLKAVSAGATGPGNPGCKTGMTFTFGPVLKNGTITIALPYGSWNLYSGSSSAQTTQIPAASLAAVSNTAPGGVTGPGTVTLDPRA